MKRIFLILMLLCVCNLYAQNYYTVTRVGSNDIRLKGHSESLKKGDRFLEESEIDWSEEKYQWFDAIDKSGQTRPFNNKSMQARGVRSILNYLKRLVSSDGFLHSKSSDFPWIDYKAENSENYPEKRLAVVIGNANYDPSQARILMNPSNDAHQISNDLKSLGFDVICLIDGNTDDMRSLISALDQNKKKYELVLLYYSGHAFQYNNSLWLQPVNANVRTPKMVEATCVNCNELLSMLSNPNKNTVVVIDGCRDEKTNFTKGSDKKERLEPNKGMLLAFATQPETEAIDIVNENDTLGPYAQAFSNSLKIEGLSLSELFDTVRFQVYQHTSKQQLPIYTNNTTSNIYLHKPTNISELSVTQEEDELVIPVHLDKSKFAYQPLDYIDSLIMNDPEACYFKGVQLQDTLWLLRAGELGYSDAFLWLGRMYSSKYDFDFDLVGTEYYQLYPDKGVDATIRIDDSLSVIYLLKAAELGNSDAMYRLGLAYYFGKGVNRDYYETEKWFLRASQNGLSIASYSLANMYRGIEKTKKNRDCYISFHKNYAEATRLFEFYFVQPQARPGRYLYSILGQLYKNGGYGLDKNRSLAHKYLKMAKAKAKEEEYYKDSVYNKGWDLYKDNNAEAVKYLIRASKKYPQAHDYLSRIYLYGRCGVEEDVDLAIYHYDLFPKKYLHDYDLLDDLIYANTDNSRCAVLKYIREIKNKQFDDSWLCMKIGDFFYEHRYSNVDYFEALYWYKKAVLQEIRNFDLKYCPIGEIYEKGGYGVIPNIEKALIWYRLADDKAALKRLGFSD